MNGQVTITLLPLGVSFQVPRGTPLQEVLFTYGVEFPCGGNAQCEGCKVKVLRGNLARTPAQEVALSARDLAAGWRLSCCCSAETDLTLELAQWEVEVLADNSRIEVTPRDGFGVAVDLGTTTLAAQLLDLRTGKVLGVQTGLNQQARYGADVMSRISYALKEDGARKLTESIRNQVGELISGLVRGALIDPSLLRDAVVVGNTVMHHLFCGIDVAPLSQYPFEPVDNGLKAFAGRDLGWGLVGGASVKFLPCLGGFVGSDVLAGILATGIHKSDALVGLVDLGTNGEVVIGSRERLLCCSTAAGPAFEGSQISMGMRASTGAIVEVKAREGRLECKTLGNVAPRGICGSGLVDAVAAGLDMKLIEENGRLAQGKNALTICPPVEITQGDIRELQVAKAAIAAGIRLLLEDLNAPPERLQRLYLAGAFGNYINRESAHRIGLFGFPLEKVEPAGNTALHGAKLGLFSSDEESYVQVRQRTHHMPLNMNIHFQEVFVEEMNFPYDYDDQPQHTWEKTTGSPGASS